MVIFAIFVTFAITTTNNNGVRLHHDNKNVIRNFLFLGFQPIAPGAVHDNENDDDNDNCSQPIGPGELKLHGGDGYGDHGEEVFNKNSNNG